MTDTEIAALYYTAEGELSIRGWPTGREYNIALTRKILELAAAQLAAPVLTDSALRMDVIRQAYGWTMGTDGELHGLIAGDMGYEPTGIKLDAETLRIWNLGCTAAQLAAPVLTECRHCGFRVALNEAPQGAAR